MNRLRTKHYGFKTTNADLLTPSVVDTVTVVLTITGFEVSTTVPVVEPPGTNTVVTGNFAELLLVSVSVVPALGATPLSVTLSVVVSPPLIAFGVMVTLSSVATLTVIGASFVTAPLRSAVMFGVTVAATP